MSSHLIKKRARFISAMRVLGPAVLLVVAKTAAAASLQVAPVLVEVPAPGMTSSLTLRNEGPRPIGTQVRVFRWTQVDGEDVLEPTNAVAASPPMVSLASRANYTVRLVRTDRRPVEKEEAYRVLADELPDPGTAKAGTVSLVLRHSVPVFFMPAKGGEPKLQWSSRLQNGYLELTLDNTGTRRVRISQLKVSDGKNTVNFGNGLVGYALAGSRITWTRAARGLKSGALSVEAQGDLGPIRATASPGR